MFDALLDEVRTIRGGRWVDLRERLALNRLLLAYEGATLDELRTAVVALLAGSQDEAAAVERAFRALYQAQTTAKPPLRASRPPARALAVALLIPWLALALVLGLNQLAPLTPLAQARLAAERSEPEQSPQEMPTEPWKGAGTPIVERIYRLSGLSNSPQWRLFSPPTELLVLAALAAVLGVAWQGRKTARIRRSRWRDERWEELAGTEGPREYGIELPKGRSSSVLLQQLARSLEQAAGRAQDATYLDVAETVARTAQNAFPTLVYAAKHAVGRVLVLRDGSPTMAPWRGKIDRLLNGIGEQVVVDVLYFDRTPTSVSRLPGQPQEPLRSWATQYGGLPLLLLSDGDFFARHDLPLHTLRESFEPWPVRVLLHPLADAQSWPAELTRTDAVLPGFSMSKRGYASLQRWLSAPSKSARERLAVEHRPLDPGDVLRLRAMLSFMPQPSFEVAELIRSELLPLAPEAILSTIGPALERSARARSKVAEARGWLRESFARRPADATAFLAFWNQFVRDPGSGAAHQRYLRDRAILALYLSSPEEAAKAAGELGRSALADDWLEELQRVQQSVSVPSLQRMAGELETTLAGTASLLARSKPGRWALSWAGLLTSSMLALLVLLLGELATAEVQTGVLPDPARPLECGAEGLTRCGEQCFDLTKDPAHCGDCSTACGSGQSCQARRCACAPPSTLCGAACVDTQKDATNCGACGKRCAGLCQAGVCQVFAAVPPAECPAGQTKCGSKCFDLTSDSSHCGQCGTNCGVRNAARSCKAGICQPPVCADGWGNCDGMVRNGCETNLSTVDNCGICGNKCGGWPNRASSCTASMCVPGSCTSAMADCDGDWANGCEVNLSTSANHCGKCGAACQAGETCGSGSCRKPGPAIETARSCSQCDDEESACVQSCDKAMISTKSCMSTCRARKAECSARCRPSAATAPPAAD